MYQDIENSLADWLYEQRELKMCVNYLVIKGRSGKPQKKICIQ
jgi:hypothetical protein